MLVRLAAYSGLRAGEIEGLRARRVDLDRRRVEVAEALTEVGGKLVFGEPKTYQRRSAPLPASFAAELAPLVERLSPDDLVFRAPGGGPIRHHNLYARHFRPVAERIGVPSLRFHDLRHTYAAWLIAQGAYPRAMMERLGHSSVQVTLDRYGHLLPGLEEGVTAGLDDAFRAAAPVP